ncbi:MAG TPA: glycosyltransferase [Patescibacteria group bacterium]|nr:glycosyltransferase [Patescibacteria group bacterium]
MRIAFVYDAMFPYCSGGAERRFHELARRLAIRNDVHYVTWRYWGDDPILIHDGITYHGVGAPRPFYGADGRRIVREQLAFAARVPGALARIHPDVVDISATPFLPVYAAWFGTRLIRTPLVATWHEFWGEHWHTYLDDRRLLARLARIGEAAARPLADRRVAVSAFTARRLVGETPPRAGRGWQDATEIVPNGVDVEALAAAGSTEPAARRIDVVFVGRLIAEKRVDLLIRTIATLAPSRPWLRCEIVGEGPERESLDALVRELGTAAQVTLTGHLPEAELPQRLGTARILAMPSAREGYGITVVEGQAAGAVPIVARSRLSAAADLVEPGVDGLVVDGTVEAFAEAIADLLDHPASLDRVSAAARATGARRGWDDRAVELERIYASLVVGRRPRARRRSDDGQPVGARNWGAGV